MIQQVNVINHDGKKVEIPLSFPFETGLNITEITGIGPEEHQVNITEYSTIDGGEATSSRRGVRNIFIMIKYMPCETIEETRRLSYEMFNPGRPIRLEFITDITKVYIDGFVESNSPTIFDEKTTGAISILCADPYFYNLLGQQITKIGHILPMFEFIYWNETEPNNGRNTIFGEYADKMPTLIQYDGQADIGMDIRVYITGPVEGFVLHNVHTYEKFEIDTSKITSITGEPLQYGDEIRIVTIRGARTVTLVRKTNIINIMSCVIDGSDWLLLRPGENWFVYTTDGEYKNINIQIFNRIAYGGI